MKDQVYLITGGCGFIGGHLVDYIFNININNTVIVVDDNSNGNYFHEKAKYLKKNVSDITINDLKNIDVVYHLAGILDVQSSLSNPSKYYEENSTIVYKLLDKCVKCNIKKFIYASSCASKYPESSPYASSKFIPELYCKNYNSIYDIDTASLRFFNVYGDRMDHSGYRLVLSIFIEQYKNNQPLTITGDGTQTRDFVHVLDVVSALYKCSGIQINGEVLNVGSGNHQKIIDIVKMFDVPYQFIEEREEPIIEHVDLTRTKNILNWKPEQEIKEFIKCQKN